MASNEIPDDACVPVCLQLPDMDICGSFCISVILALDNSGQCTISCGIHVANELVPNLSRVL
jgi:hypothetical protein